MGLPVLKVLPRAQAPSHKLERNTSEQGLPNASDLPLGVVTHANWPLAVSRIISPDLTPGQMFQSPKGEGAWISKSNNTYYVFPNWPLDLTDQKEELQRAGYTLFVSLQENIPKGVKMKSRPGLWNWNLNLL